MGNTTPSRTHENVRMSSTVPLVSTTIHCGAHNVTTTAFNIHSSIDEIHRQVRVLCGAHVPNEYCLKFYHLQLKTFVKINQKYLFGQSNIFRVDSSIIAHNENHLDFWVVDMATEYDTPSGVGCQEINSSGFGDVMTESVSEEDVPVNARETNVNNSSGEDIVNAVLSKEEDDISLLMHNLSTSNDQESSSVHPNETQVNADSIPINPSSDNINRDSTDLHHALLTDRPSIQSLPVTHISSRSIPTGVTMPLENTSAIRTEVQFATESIETQIISLPRPYISLDVKPIQKDIYQSDQFSQTKPTKRNGYVTRIQGIKTSAQRMSSVWPRVRIPEFFWNRPNTRLVVYVVSEKIQNGLRVWSQHRDKGFLPKGFTRQTPPINPIKFNATRNNLTGNGDLILELPMTTLWNRFVQHPVLYQLDEQTTISLHPALHDAISPRLLCLLEDDIYCYWNTVCLSDFIRSVNPTKRARAITHGSAQSSPIARKRTREN